MSFLGNRFVRIKRRLLVQTALSTPVLVAVGASAVLGADVGQSTYESVAGPLPAVSGINGKLDLAVGGTTPGYDLPFFSNDFEEAFRAQGFLSVPVGHSFGMQADGAVALIQDELFAHTAGHLFWRDPAVGLAGLYGAYSVWDDLDRWRVAFEGEAYLGQISVETVTGVEFGDVPDHFFTITDFAYYPHDDFRVSLGFRSNSSGNSLAAGGEYQFASSAGVATSLYVDAEIGDDDYQKIFGGMRLYFGEDKSLIRRHREDDPYVDPDERSLTGCTTDEGVLAVDSLGPNPCNEDTVVR